MENIGGPQPSIPPTLSTEPGAFNTNPPDTESTESAGKAHGGWFCDPESGVCRRVEGDCETSGVAEPDFGIKIPEIIPKLPPDQASVVTETRFYKFTDTSGKMEWTKPEEKAWAQNNYDGLMKALAEFKERGFQRVLFVYDLPKSKDLPHGCTGCNSLKDDLQIKVDKNKNLAVIYVDRMFFSVLTGIQTDRTGKDIPYEKYNLGFKVDRKNLLYPMWGVLVLGPNGEYKAEGDGKPNMGYKPARDYVPPIKEPSCNEKTLNEVLEKFEPPSVPSSTTMPATDSTNSEDTTTSSEDTSTTEASSSTIFEETSTTDDFPGAGKPTFVTDAESACAELENLPESVNTLILVWGDPEGDPESRREYNSLLDFLKNTVGVGNKDHLNERIIVFEQAGLPKYRIISSDGPITFDDGLATPFKGKTEEITKQIEAIRGSQTPTQIDNPLPPPLERPLVSVLLKLCSNNPSGSSLTSTTFSTDTTVPTSTSEIYTSSTEELTSTLGNYTSTTVIPTSTSEELISSTEEPTTTTAGNMSCPATPPPTCPFEGADSDSDDCGIPTQEDGEAWAVFSVELDSDIQIFIKSLQGEAGIPDDVFLERLPKKIPKAVLSGQFEWKKPQAMNYYPPPLDKRAWRALAVGDRALIYERIATNIKWDTSSCNDIECRMTGTTVGTSPKALSWDYIWRPINEFPNNPDKFLVGMNLDQKLQYVVENTITLRQDAEFKIFWLDTGQALANAIPFVYGVSEVMYGEHKILGAVAVATDFVTFGISSGIRILRTSQAAAISARSCQLVVLTGASVRVGNFALNPTLGNGIDAALAAVEGTFVGLHFFKIMIKGGVGRVASIEEAEALGKIMGRNADDILENGFSHQDLARFGIKIVQGTPVPSTAVSKELAPAVTEMLNQGPGKWVCVGNPKPAGGRPFSRGLSGDFAGAGNGVREADELFKGAKSEGRFVFWEDSGIPSNPQGYSNPIAIAGRTCEVVDDFGKMGRANFTAKDIDKIAILIRDNDKSDWALRFVELVEKYKSAGFQFRPGSRGETFFREVSEAVKSCTNSLDGSINTSELDAAMEGITSIYH